MPAVDVTAAPTPNWFPCLVTVTWINAFTSWVWRACSHGWILSRRESR